jgi:tight adherence protein B
VTAAAVMAFAAGAAGALALVEALREAGAAARARARRVAVLGQAFLRIGREGRDPGAAERRRLLLAAAGMSFFAGTLLIGPLVGAALAAAAPWAGARALRMRRERYRAAVDDGAAGMALALADAMTGGHSLRGALTEAARAVPGPAGRELARVAGELAAGARTDAALDAMRARARSERLDTLVAACLLQRRAGGDLARLLRDCAGSFEDHARLAGEVRTATAQARFTGAIVVFLPAGGALLAELASPGFVAGLWSSFLTAWLVGLALGLQVVAAVLIRRLGRVRW